MFICVLGGFAVLVSLCQATPVVEGVVGAGSTPDIPAVEKLSHAAAVSTDTPAAPTRGPLCSELPCRMRNPDYVRRYVHDLSLAREREYDFQVQYVQQQEFPHKREVFFKVERWVRTYPELSEQHRDTLARVYSELRAQRYRAIYNQYH